MTDERAPSTAAAPLAVTAAALREGRLDPVEHAEACCDRAATVDGAVRAFLDEPGRPDRLRREAADLLARFPHPADRPPLFGVPVGVKDIFHVDGFETRAGADLPPGALAGEEATAVTRLREAGALVFGKTVTTEFAYFEPGPTRNPHDPGHTPGGSSSGSAAAVAAGMVPLALGTQTAGSTIRPAAFCGVVGFKPTFGRVPTKGVLPLAPSVDTVGSFTQDVAGARLAASVLCDGWDEVAAAGNSDERPTLGVPADAYVERASAVAVERYEDQIDRLREAGYDVVHAPALGDVDAVLERHEALMAAEAARSHHDWFEAHGGRYSAVMAGLVRDGRERTDRELAEARAGRGELRGAVEALMAERGVDAWVAPAAPGPAPEGLDSTGDPVMNAPWTYAGMPAVSVPAGRVDGLPVGLQCVSAAGEDERLLSWAAGLADAVGGDDGPSRG